MPIQWCWLGNLCWFAKTYHRVLLLPWKLLNFMEAEETWYCFTFIIRGWILSSCFNHMWDTMTYLLSDLHITCSSLTILYCHNQSALHITANPMFHEWTIHLDIDCHIVREKAQIGLMHLLPVSFSNQLAGIFTKALPHKLLIINLSKLISSYL